FDVAGRGFLREGYWADLVLVEDTPFTVTRGQVLSRCGWSPFEGTTFRSRIASTWVNGELAWDGARLVGEPCGRRLGFSRRCAARCWRPPSASLRPARWPRCRPMHRKVPAPSTPRLAKPASCSLPACNRARWSSAGCPRGAGWRLAGAACA